MGYNGTCEHLGEFRELNDPQNIKPQCVFLARRPSSLYVETVLSMPEIPEATSLEGATSCHTTTTSCIQSRL